MEKRERERERETEKKRKEDRKEGKKEGAINQKIIEMKNDQIYIQL